MLRNSAYGTLCRRFETPADAGGAACLMPTRLSDPGGELVDQVARGGSRVALIRQRVVETQ